MRSDSFSVIFYLALNKKMDSGEYPIYARIYINREKSEISTRQHLANLEDWDKVMQRVKHKTPINTLLSKMEGDIRNIYDRLKYNDKEISAVIVKNIFLGRTETSALLTDLMDKYYRERIITSTTISEATVNNYKATFAHVREFLKSVNQTKITLKQLDEAFIRKFDSYMSNLAATNKENQTLKRNTVNKYLVKFKSIILYAIGEGLMDKNPFSNIKFKMQKTTRTFLTKPELEALENHNLSGNESLIKVRDIFMFSVYSGLRFSDAMALKTGNIEFDGIKHWLLFQQEKTKEHIRLPLLNKGKEILDKYQDEQKASGYVLPRITNQKTNSYLKVIADIVGFKKPLTHHVARHTAATTIFLANGVPIEVVSKQLGHSSIKITQIYAKITNDLLSKAADKIDDILKAESAL